MAQVDVLWIKKLDYPKDWGIRGHSHDFRQLFYVTDGAGRVQVGEQDFTFQENYCILMKPYEFHRLYRTVNGCTRLIDVKFNTSSPTLDQMLERMPSCFQVPSGELLSLLSTVRDEWKSAHNQYPTRHLFEKELADVLMEELIYRILRTQAEAPVRDSTGELTLLTQKFPGISGQIADYLSDHYNQEFSLDDLASKLCYNKNYLCKVFKSATGYTIKSYVNLLRIRKATELICNSNKKLSEISDEIGFKDIHHFNRVYKKIMGETPGNVRIQEKEGMHSDIIAHGDFIYRYYSSSDAE